MSNEENIIRFSTPQQLTWLDKFIHIYQKLSVDNLFLLTELYHEDIHFQDPMHELHGIKQLHHYFQSLYENLSECRFEITNVLVEDDQAAVYWQMTYQHPKLNKGKTVQVEGHTHIKGQGNYVIYHRDYLDLGNMLYEQIPALGTLVKWVKSRAQP